MVLLKTNKYFENIENIIDARYRQVLLPVVLNDFMNR